MGKVLVIDGQGGGVGKSLVHAIKALLPGQEVIAIGTNAAATGTMLRAGADKGATGENALIYQCQQADIIVGVMGILIANAMMGEISPAMAAAVSASPAQKVLIPMEQCGLHVAGIQAQPLDRLVQEAAVKVQALCEG